MHSKKPKAPEPHGCTMPVLLALPLVMTKSWLTLEVLGAIERLLFLQQEGIADERKTAHGLAMSSAKKSGN